MIGGIALLVTGGTAVTSGITDLHDSSRPDMVYTVPVDGIDSLVVDVDASSMRIEFGDVEQAELVVTNLRGPSWRFERKGDQLIVNSTELGWKSWFGNLLGEKERAVLTLPKSLREARLDSELTLNAGALDLVGDFGGLVLEVNAGELDVDASATSFELEMNAGNADIELSDVSEATFTVNVGEITAELTGTPPSQTLIEVNAGSLDVIVPDADYAITHDFTLGSLDVNVDESDSARRTIEVSLTAGTVTINPGD